MFFVRKISEKNSPATITRLYGLSFFSSIVTTQNSNFDIKWSSPPKKDKQIFGK